jgi:hypothetical protein
LLPLSLLIYEYRKQLNCEFTKENEDGTVEKVKTANVAVKELPLSIFPKEGFK